MQVAESKGSSPFFAALIGGSLVALGGLLVFGPLAAAIDLSLEVEAPKLIHTLTTVLAFAALFLGGWAAGKVSAGHGAATVLGAAVWSATAISVVVLMLMDFDLPDFGIVSYLGDDEVLLPFASYAAWLRVLSILVSLTACVAGTWLGAHSFERLPNKIRRWRGRTTAHSVG